MLVFYPLEGRLHVALGRLLTNDDSPTGNGRLLVNRVLTLANSVTGTCRLSKESAMKS